MALRGTPILVHLIGTGYVHTEYGPDASYTAPGGGDIPALAIPAVSTVSQ